MGLLSFFKRQPDKTIKAPAPAEPDAVAAARARARRRLLGATVLLGLGVIGFPLLFETQPRPIPVNIPIEIPRKDAAPPLLPPGAAAPLSRASAALVNETPAAAPAEVVERASDAGKEVAASPPLAAASRGAPVAVKPPVPPSPPPRSSDEGARARALLEGQSPANAASAPAARVVVQVGAYTDAGKLAEARRKLETLGLKTYTQVVETEAGQRTRVRVGPFASRAEADKAAARIKAAGLPVAILTL